MQQLQRAATAVAMSASALTLLAGCTQSTSEPAPGEAAPSKTTSTKNFVNGGFESGTAGSATIPNWTETTYLNSNGPSTVPPTTFAQLNLAAATNAVSDQTYLTAAGGGTAAALATADSLRYPFDGAESVVVNQKTSNKNTNLLSQTMTVAAADLDPSDGLMHIRMAVAPVLGNALGADAHTAQQDSYLYVEILNNTTGQSLFHTWNFNDQPGVVWQHDAAYTTGTAPNTKQNEYFYTNWQAFNVAPGAGQLNIGDSITANVIGAGCTVGGHIGEVYVDDFSTRFPYPTVTVSAPAYLTDPATGGTTITYTVTARNSGTSPATGVVASISPPVVADNTQATTGQQTLATTFASYSAPGATCTAPATGAAGDVVCNVGQLAAGGSYTYTVTYNVPSYPTTGTGAFVAPVNVNEGTYSISTTERPTPLSGPLVQTQLNPANATDLQATLSDGISTIAASTTTGTADTYTFTVTNKGPTAVSGAAITSVASSVIGITSWTCAATGTGTSCGAASGTTGAISTTATIPVNGSVTYTVKTTVKAAADTYPTFTMVATPPAADTQNVPFDNVGTDRDYAATTPANTAKLTVNKAGNGDGTVTSSPTGISCAAGVCTTANATYQTGQTVALFAVPQAGQSFTGWTGGTCTGTTNPCNVVIGTAADTETANFAAPTFATKIASTSNGTSLTDVRPGDTVKYEVTLNIPYNGNAGEVLSEVFPNDIAFPSTTTCTTKANCISVPTVTGTVLCNGASCASATYPSYATSGSTTSFDFGAVTCTSTAGCTIDFLVTGQVGTGSTVVRGNVDAATFSLAGGTSTATPPTATTTASVTIDEPNLTVSAQATPAMGVVRGQTTTVVVTLANNSGGANSPAYDVVDTVTTPANTTAGNFQVGTCTGLTANGTDTVFTLASSLANGTSCTFSYDLTIGNGSTPGSTIAIAGGTATSYSLPGTAAGKKYTYTDANGTSVTTALLPVNATCAQNSDCADNICETGLGGDNKCGIQNGDTGHACTPGADANCQSDNCLKSGVCGAPNTCATDVDCDPTQYCNNTAPGIGVCAAKLANESAIPTDAFHSPAFAAKCTSAAIGASVCASGVCDETTNKCGLELTHGANDGHDDATCVTTGTVATCNAGVCVTTGTNAGRCEICAADAQCSGVTPACNTTTNTCVACTGTNTTACTGRTAACDTTTNACVGCNGDLGSGTTFACAEAAAPFCNTDPTSGGACSNTCTTDAECGSGNWCDAGACTAQLTNGTPIPTVPGHSPALAGTCTAANGSAVCQSGACDTTDNKCGVAVGDGTCTATTECRSGTCVTSGTNSGKCEACVDDSACGGTTPVCNTSTNQCAQCNGTNDAACTGATPVCNTAMFTCAGCNGDFGSTATLACPSSAANCNMATGACGTACVTDAECGSAKWCDAGTCAAQLANGTPIPTVGGHTPALTGTCNAAVATAVCLSDACDAKTNTCGIAAGDGTCSNDGQCINNACDTATGVCSAGTVSGADGGVVSSSDGGLGSVVAGNSDDGFEVRGDGCSVDGSSSNANGFVEFGSLLAVLGFAGSRRRKSRRDLSGGRAD